MRAVVQRVASAAVTVDDETVGAIGRGVLVLLGVAAGDTVTDAALLARKVAELRIFPDDRGRFDRSLLDAAGDALVVSQFTLIADIRRGRRPSFTGAAPPDEAKPLVEAFAASLRRAGVGRVETGRFGAAMRVALVNDGPVTLVVDTADLARPRRARGDRIP